MAESNITNSFSQLYLGLNLDSIMSQIKPGQWTYSLNAITEGFDGNSITIQNEEANVLCTNFPAGYRIVGIKPIIEKNIIVCWLATSGNLNSEIGIIDTNKCLYIKKVNDPCLGFRIDKPILKSIYKVTHKGTEVYWTDGNMPMRYMDLDNIPYKEIQTEASCENIITDEVDCNKLNIQPNFLIPELSIISIGNEGTIEAGVYQFAIQYSNALSEAYTSYYSITNPIGVFDVTKITQDFNYTVNKSLEVEISNIDTSGVYDYFNLAVLKTVNNITTPYLVGTYKITAPTQKILYTGQNKIAEPLTLAEITEKYPVYKTADDVTTAQDIAIWKGMTLEERISYQEIASKLSVKWQTYRIKNENAIKNPHLLYKYKGYMRDEVYPLELVFLLSKGRQSDRFPLIGRKAISSDLTPVNNNLDIIQEENNCIPDGSVPPTWKVYNTAQLSGYSQEYLDSVANASDPACYVGPYQYGEMAYWESTDLYPCDINMWGELANTPIRHHKFPDCAISPIYDGDGYIYPIGIKIDVEELKNLIISSSLTEEQKNDIVGFKIVRGNRANSKSVVAKGLINNVLKYTEKNNQISVSGGSLSQSTDPVQTLIDRAISLLLTGIKGTTPLFNNDAIEYAQDAVNQLNAAKGQEYSSPQFYVFINQATTSVNNALSKTDNEKMTAYLQGALDTIGAVSQTAEAYAQLGATEQPVNTITSTQDGIHYFPNYLFNDVRNQDAFLNNIIVDESSKYRQTFHSPDTSFFQPSLGNVLKLETAESGFSSGHIVQVKDHAKYQFITSTAYITALLSGLTVGFASGTYGFSTNVFNGTAAMTSYQAILDIIYKIVPRKNFAYQYNAIGEYSISKPVPNNGNKQRKIDIGRYLSPTVESVGDDYSVNNWQRESSVYIKTSNPIPYVNEISGITDISKTIIPSFDTFVWPISSYYASIKNNLPNQYGQIFSYDVVDTGFQMNIDLTKNYSSHTIFGGDVFINKFSYKSKMPFFIDNRVKAVDESDVFYNELSNVGKVKYWFSTDVTEKSSIFNSLFGIKSHNFFWRRDSFFTYDGSIFLFAYGIPTFFCESEVNVNYRQAYNNLEGDFYPRVGSGIPDDWLQESRVSIINDNTYFYNKSFSKQNQGSNTFTYLPPDYFNDVNRNVLPFRAVFSDKQQDEANYRLNNWRIYRPASKFDFPQNYGKLISIDGIENREVLARFENKTLLYNALLTAPTSAADVYLGQSLFSQQVPPLDFADTDLGYVGSQNKFLLKTEYGMVTADAKRGQVFLLNGRQPKELTNEYVNKFFTEFLQFEIQKTFPDYNIDNHLNGCGLHGVYDPKYDRFILTKIDYKPITSNIIYKNSIFVKDGKQIELTDTNYFCNYSFTISYSFKTQSWISFHTYIPNFYVGFSNVFFSGNNYETCSIWKHNSTFNKFNNYYGIRAPYIIEYPIAYKYNDELLQNIQDYSKILRYSDFGQYIQTDDVYFSHAIIYNDQQCSGTRRLTKKPKNNLSEYGKYPVYRADEIEILYTKSNSFYQFNTFWALNRSSQQPMWKRSCQSLSIFKEINDDNMNYSKRAFNKAPIRAKDCRIRLINKEQDEYKFISQFLISNSQISFK